MNKNKEELEFKETTLKINNFTEEELIKLSTASYPEDIPEFTKSRMREDLEPEELDIDIESQEPIKEESRECGDDYGDDGCPGEIEPDFLTCDDCKQEYEIGEEHLCPEKPEPEPDLNYEGGCWECEDKEKEEKDEE